MSAQARAPVPACSQAPLGASCCCCKFCEIGGCDVLVMNCGCCLHARCCPVKQDELLAQCPVCFKPASTLQLIPMNFEEIDHARKQASLTAVSDKRGKKRKNATIARLTSTGAILDEASPANNAGEGSDLRTGRWTQEETEYCDILIQFFEQGKLPIPENLKLNEFLANMLKSKQSRLTKKMKNARLSARQYKRTQGYIPTVEEAQAFSRLETEFFASIKCPLERSEIRFHMQKEWRELFSSCCIALGQTLDANDWLYSVEELDRRASLKKDAERMVRRKVMMGHALTYDASNSTHRGVYIDAASSVREAAALSRLPTAADVSESQLSSHELAKQDKNPMKHYASPFLGKIMHLIDRYNMPFEYVDAWVPSFVQADMSNPEAGPATNGEQEQKCRLCFAGCATADNKVPAGGNKVIPLTDDEKFHLLSFGEYSQKFSFDVGCGLPGRVYSSGVASWEQGIQNAPLAQFERCGGATQWGIQTVLGVPIPSPTVGRIVVLFYSVLDRARNLSLVNRIAEDLNKLRPSPKWKLVVDVGVRPPARTGEATDEEVQLESELLHLIEKCTPANKNSPFASYLPGFTSLRLLLMQENRSSREDELVKSTLSCFDGYKKVGRSESDIAMMTARDFMALSKQSSASTGQPARVGSGIGTISHNFGSRQQILQQHKMHQPQHATAASNMGLQASTHYTSIPTPAGQLNAATQSYGQQTGELKNDNLFLEPNLPGSFPNGSNNAGGFEQLPSLGPSPALFPISSQPDNANGMPPMGLTPSQINALLQNEGT